MLSDSPLPIREEITAAMDALRRIVRVLRASSVATERAVGLSGAQMFILKQVQAVGSSSIQSLADLTHTHQSSVSTVVSKLVERGLVTREPAPDDRRRMEVTLTVAGSQVLQDGPAVAQTALVEGLARLAPADRAALVQGLGAWVTAIGADDHPAELFFENTQESTP